MKATVEVSGVGRRTNIARARRGSKKDPVTRDIGIRTILVPIDFSRASLQAIEWAKFIAQDGRGSIHLVHAHDLQYPLVLPISPPIILSHADIQDRLRRDLISVATKYRIADADAHSHIKTGPAFDQICKLADEIHADLIVTSTHGHTGWKRVFLGSTAERVVRHTPCPVLVARRSKAAARKPRLKKILVPLDFSKCSLKGLRFAVKLAQSFNAKLVLLHAAHLDYHATADGYAMYAEADLRKHMREAADKQMRALIRTTDFGGVAFDTAIWAGFPEESANTPRRTPRISSLRPRMGEQGCGMC